MDRNGSCLDEQCEGRALRGRRWELVQRHGRSRTRTRKRPHNRTDFGNLVHPKTGERDGAVFVLFLQERKFSYYASDAQDRRNLGDG